MYVVKSRPVQFSDPVDGGKPEEVLEEVRTLSLMVAKDFDWGTVEAIYRDVDGLFAGLYPGYRRCETKYHDLEHTTDIFLAMARLIHGAHASGLTLSRRGIRLGLTAALMHDTGYIQRSDDRIGTGAKYTAVHIDRSIDFMEHYLRGRGWLREDFEVCRCALHCTGLSARLDRISFPTEESRTLGMMLGTADLLGQMASRAYLEKLPFLYQELREGKLLNGQSEFEFLRETPSFYRQTLERMKNELGGVSRFMKDHFRARREIDRDLCLAAIEENMACLESILESHPGDCGSFLQGSLLKGECPWEAESTGFSSSGDVSSAVG
jgi:hypothetical protein